jgi:hypothetical protein
MHRIDTPSALPAAPALVAGTSPQGWFTGGNPMTGVPPTIIDDRWLNSVQDEIANVITGAPVPQALSPTSNAQLLAAIQSMLPAPRRVQVTTTASEAGSQIPVKAWFTGTLYQYAEPCIDPSIHHACPDQQELAWWMVGIRNVTANPITITATIVAVDDGANVYWQGASIASAHGDADSGGGGTATANITIAAGAEGILDVLYYNRTSGANNPGILIFSLGSPFPAGLVLYDPGTVFA